MRSRYSAYSTGDVSYLNTSWHPDTRPADLTLVSGRRWVGLEIVETEGGRQLDSAGVVEFVASFDGPDGGGTQHERSRFIRLDGRWVYLDGETSS